MKRTSYCWLVKPLLSCTSGPIAQSRSRSLCIQVSHSTRSGLERANDQIAVLGITILASHISLWVKLKARLCSVHGRTQRKMSPNCPTNKRQRLYSARSHYMATISTLFRSGWITLWARWGISNQDLSISWPATEWTTFTWRYQSWTFQIWEGLLWGSYFSILETCEISSTRSSLLLCAYSCAKWVRWLCLWTHEPLIYKRLMSKVCGNVRHYITTAIQWSSNVRVLYW